MKPIDKGSPVPAYFQIQKIIMDEIASGVWAPKTRIPSERELAEQFNVSRMTMRQALANLTQSGLLTREIGRGTFVAEPQITQPLSLLTSFSDDMRARGMRPHARVQSLELETVSPEIAARLQVDLSRPIVVMKRLRLADDEPMSLETCNLSFAGCESLLQQNLSGSLYELLRFKYNVLPTRAQQQIRAGLSTKDESKLLGIKDKSPVLRLSRLTFDQDGRPFEFVESAYRGDKYIFDTELLNAAKAPSSADGRP